MGGISASTSTNAAAYISFTSGGLLNEGNNPVGIVLCDSTEEEGGSAIRCQSGRKNEYFEGNQNQPVSIVHIMKKSLMTISSTQVLAHRGADSIAGIQYRPAGYCIATISGN